MSDDKASAQGFLDAIARYDVTIAVIGLGYVGLPLSLVAAQAGFNVLGFDVSSERVVGLNRGEPFIRHLRQDAVADAVRSDRFSATTDFSRLGEADAVIICVPTPLTHHGEPDLSFIRRTVAAIARTLRRGQLIVLESTTYPGTTIEVVKPILERPG